MIFANGFEEFLGTGCALFVLIVMGIGWLVSKAASSDTVKDAARVGFWAWFLSDDD